LIKKRPGKRLRDRFGKRKGKRGPPREIRIGLREQRGIKLRKRL
jgi:hypothetical protein